MHVHGPELRAATAKSAPRRYRSAHWAHGPDWVDYDELSGQSWFGFDAVRQLHGLPEEILLVPLRGHTAGHVGVAIDTGAGWLLHAGDAYFFHEQLAPSPDCPPLLRAFQRHVDTARALRVNNQRRLRRLAREHSEEITLFCAHDSAELKRFRDSAETA